jgi:hypothetical protein
MTVPLGKTNEENLDEDILLVESIETTNKQIIFSFTYDFIK